MNANTRRWDATASLKRFRSNALEGLPFNERYDWPEHTNAQAQTIWEQIAALVPDGASVLEIGCGGGGFAKALAKANPTVTYRGIDIVIENVDASRADSKADGFITCASVVGSDSVTINDVTLTASGDQTSGGLNFNEGAGSDVEVASSLVAAINDAANGLVGVVVATNAAGTSASVTVTAVDAGVAGNSIPLVSSDGTTLAVEAATLTGAVDPTSFQVAGAWDALLEENPAWDFVVSCRTLWDYTENRLVPHPEAGMGALVDAGVLMFDLLNAKAQKGWVCVADPSSYPPNLSALMEEARISSTDITSSYFTEDEGARVTLLADTLRRLMPLWMLRGSVSGVSVPDVPKRMCLTEERPARYNRIVSFMDITRANRIGDPEPTTIKGLQDGSVSSGLAANWSKQ